MNLSTTSSQFEGEGLDPRTALEKRLAILAGLASDSDLQGYLAAGTPVPSWVQGLRPLWSERQLTADGQQESVQYLELSGRWAVLWRQTRVLVTLEAEGIELEEVELEEVLDLSPFRPSS